MGTVFCKAALLLVRQHGGGGGLDKYSTQVWGKLLAGATLDILGCAPRISWQRLQRPQGCRAHALLIERCEVMGVERDSKSGRHCTGFQTWLLTERVHESFAEQLFLFACFRRSLVSANMKRGRTGAAQSRPCAAGGGCLGPTAAHPSARPFAHPPLVFDLFRGLLRHPHRSSILWKSGSAKTTLSGGTGKNPELDSGAKS